jgi:hypothetical protein
MDLSAYGVAIGRGDGLVARSGDVVMFIAGVTGASPLLRALDATAAMPSPGRALAKALTTIALGPDSGSIPPFGMLAPADDCFLVILRGHVVAEIEAGGTSRTLSGAKAITWVDETVPDPVERIAVGGNAPGLTPGVHTDLRGGVVPGGGFVVARATVAPRAAPSPPVAVAVEPQTRAGHGNPGEAAKPVERQSPLATAGAQSAAPTTKRPAALDRHGGEPRGKPAVPTVMARPAIGTLTVGDDAVYPLDRPYVIGRNPMIDDMVRSGVASPIFVPEDPQVSRVHAFVTVDTGAVLVRDAGTPGGTYLAAPGDQTWTRVGERPTEVKPGWCIRIGERILVYQRATPAQ